MKIQDGDVEAWLERISWSTLQGWLEFMDVEPIGEEREDLRTGALAAVILNTQIDHKSIGGVLHPRGYVSGWNESLEYVLMPKPIEEEDGGKQSSTEKNGESGKLNLNDPVDWENFTTGLAKMAQISSRG